MINPKLYNAITKYYPDAKFKKNSQSFPHTEIVHFKTENSKLVAKLIEEKILNSYSPKKRNKTIELLSHVIPLYYSLLKKIGVPIPQFHKVIVYSDNLIEIATDLGEKRLDTVLKKSSPAQAQRLMDKYIKAIAPVIKQKRPTVGFDAATENFLFDSKNKLVFCDFVPPRIKHNGTYIVGFPQPTAASEIQKGYERYYNPYGILRRARIFFLNTNYKLDELFFAALKNNLSAKEYKKIRSQFMKSAEFQLKAAINSKQFDKATKIIKQTNDTDTLREMAALAFWVIKKQPTPPDVYNLSRLHLHFSKKERRERLSAFKKAIIELL